MLRRRQLAPLWPPLWAPLWAAPLLAAPALRPAAAQDGAALRLTLLHLNDFHSRHEAATAAVAGCRVGEGQPACYGGSARIATAIREGRAAAHAEGRESLVLDAGDAFLGTLFFTAHRGQAEAEMQRRWGVDAFALGNHEFDLGPAVLAAFAAASPALPLCANLETAREPRLAGRVEPRRVLRFGARRVAIVGLCTPDTPSISSPGPNLRFLDPVERAARAVAELRADGEGPVTVVLLSHLGIGADRRLAERVAGVDVIVGGHSHTLLRGPSHPTLVDGPDRPVRIVQAGAHGRFLGRLDLDLGADGRVLGHGGEVRELDASVAEDPEVLAAVARLGEPLAELRRQVVGRLPAAMTNQSCASTRCALGELVAEGMRQAAGAEIGWQNGGGLRSGLPAGQVTREDTMAVLPFSNTLARVTLRGADILAALENGVSRLPAASGRFPQTSRLRFLADASRPVGERIVSPEFQGEDGAWSPLDPGRAYSVATNSFLRRGGDGYAGFAERALEARDDGPLLEDTLARFLGRASP